ncbi:phosphoribosylformylglycinamidine synthase [Sesbania bispinosa]|nr:phosphoribosylformylglycinamidine synthase [Sesbania bispinosa]
MMWSRKLRSKKKALVVEGGYCQEGEEGCREGESRVFEEGRIKGGRGWIMRPSVKAAKEEKDKFVRESLSNGLEAFDLAITQETPGDYKEVPPDLVVEMERSKAPSQSVRGDGQGDDDVGGDADKNVA